MTRSLPPVFLNNVQGSMSYIQFNPIRVNFYVWCKIVVWLPSFECDYSVLRRRQWHPTPVPLPRKSHGQRSLVGCSPWGRQELGMTATSLSLFTFMHWRRKWQPTPVFLPGESQGQGSLVGCRLWGRTESGMTEAT